MPHSKRFVSLASKVDAKKIHTPAEALVLAKDTSTTKFDGSIEVHIRLGIDAKKGDQQVRGAVSLPHGTGQTKTIAAFVGPEKEKEATAAGADIVGGQELIDKIKSSGKVDFEIAIASPDMMPKMAVIAKILGPIGLMPSPKTETITTNVTKTIGELKKGKVNFKNDDTGNVHQVIGKASFSPDQLLANFTTLLDAVRKAKPSSSKGVFIQNISVSSSMGPGVKVSLS